ncbi:F0F1 ATP synthase subunit gamma [Thalassobacter stenotrophicus]|uniref:F-ATPase gamma subunit n=2 Tax=Thalassobacter stenotrophicus TaxID=266809 RepID=A0A0P1FG68_9RHOB|nr:FoF1 ATP synthase subunit gamma [Thalassobacter stenotrophicus]PVZ47826.1 ATPase [Thalassobacter stenotrophicus]CUH59496.1 F-ATPase gamma subunit [Thalassobacter stenotrophicus]SHI82219.1 F-type H+-transporting ATPase subunit gamma [Thalassobacter stenotrophicus DSM 16310]
MSQSLEGLTRHMTGMESIHSVVHTMKTLSVLNAAPYEQAARAIEDYHRTVLDGLHAFFVATGAPDRSPQPLGQRHIVVFGSDHGLCGTYNDGIATHIAEALAGVAPEVSQIDCVGAQMADALRDRGLAPSQVFLPAASVDGLARLANLLTQHIEVTQNASESRSSSVELVYASRAADGTQTPMLVPLLPLSEALVADLCARPWLSRTRPAFAMPPDALFRALIRAHVFASLVRAAAEAMLAENAARLAVMQQAERSVEDRLDALKSEANTLRQDGITTELLDVIVGFEALGASDRRRRREDAKASDANDLPSERKQR